jgi:hypothetical protein
MRVDAPRSAIAASIVAVLALAGCGSAGSDGDAVHPSADPAPKAKPAAKPAPAGTRATAAGVSLTRDSEEAESFPLPAGTRGAKKAPLPDDAPAAPRRKASSGPDSEISPGAPSDAQIRRELKEMEQAIKNFKHGSRGSGSAAVRRSTTAATPRRRSGRRTSSAGSSPAATRSRSSPTSGAAATGRSSTAATTARAR